MVLQGVRTHLLASLAAAGWVIGLELHQSVGAARLDAHEGVEHGLPDVALMALTAAAYVLE